MDRRAQVHREPLSGHLEEAETWDAWPQGEVRASVSKAVDDLQVGVHDYAAGYVLADQDPLGLSAHFGEAIQVVHSPFFLVDKTSSTGITPNREIVVEG